jgi:esterase
MKLFCKQYSEIGESLVILHGLFGNQGNWGQHAKLLANTFAVYGMDHRNHGRSEWENAMDYGTMAMDVRQTMRLHHIEKAHFIGHSMGGKTAMQLALTQPTLVDKLVVVDIAPVAYEPHHAQIFAGLKELDLDLIDNRQDADEVLEEYVPEKNVRDFLLANLVKDEEGNFGWRMNLDAIIKGYDDLLSGLSSATPFEGDVLFLKGSKSDYVLKKFEKQILKLFPKAEIEEVKGAGHWLHAEQPETFQTAVYKFLKG